MGGVQGWGRDDFIFLLVEFAWQVASCYVQGCHKKLMTKVVKIVFRNFCRPPRSTCGRRGLSSLSA